MNQNIINLNLCKARAKRVTFNRNRREEIRLCSYVLRDGCLQPYSEYRQEVLSN